MSRMILLLALGLATPAAAQTDEAEAYRLDSLRTKALNDRQLAGLRPPPPAAAPERTAAEQALHDRVERALADWRRTRPACPTPCGR